MSGVQFGEWGGRVGNWGDEISLNGEDGENVCLNFLQPLLENVDRRSCNGGSRELFPIFHNLHWKG